MCRQSAMTVVANLLSVLLLATAFTPVHAATIYVDASATPPGNGLSWDTAYTDLQTALLLDASSGDDIWVRRGTYYPTSGVVRTVTFQLKNGVRVFGGFDGTETLLSERVLQRSTETILSGNIGDADSISDNSFTVVTGSGTDMSAVLDGFTVQDGNADGALPTDPIPEVFGGGMFNRAGSPTVANVLFRDNRAVGGAGMLNINSSPTLTGVFFDGNSAITSGGGMYIDSTSSPTLTDVHFTGNSAGADGAGLYSAISSLTLTNVTFADNMADTCGGGIFLASGSATISNATFSGNGANEEGGGAWSAGTLSFTDVSFRVNRVLRRGGAFFDCGSSTLTNVLFELNVAFDLHTTTTIRGGGMFSDAGSPALTNVVFCNNTTISWYGDALGAGMYNDGSSPTLINVSFGGNWGANAGGGMYNVNGSAPTLINTVMWGNIANISGSQIENSDSLPTISYSDIQGSGGSGGGWDVTLGIDNGNNIDVDPMFDQDLPSPGKARGNLFIYSSSPLVNAGNSAAVPVGVTTDINGEARIFGASVDIGAYEVQNAPTGFGDDEHSTPRATAIRSINPNPFNPTVTVEFELDVRKNVRITIYDVRGRLVRELVDEVRDPGVHQVRWDGQDNAGRIIPSGVYFLLLRSEGWTEQRKLVLLK